MLSKNFKEYYLYNKLVMSDYFDFFPLHQFLEPDFNVNLVKLLAIQYMKLFLILHLMSKQFEITNNHHNFKRS